MTTVSLKLPDPLAIRLAETAASKKHEQVRLIRDALEAYLRSDDAVGKDSALAHAAD